MHPELKKFWLGVGLIMGGLIMAIFSIIFLSHTNNQKFFAWFVVGIVIFCIGLGVAITFTDHITFRLVRRWCKLKLGKSIEFPDTLKERVALQQWAGDKLKTLAVIASRSFERRNEISRVLDEQIPEDVYLPHHLLPYRKYVANRHAEYREAEYYSEQKNRVYLSHWDFFKDMGMLPKNPKTGEPWDNPKVFREHLEEKEVVGVVPVDEIIQRSEGEGIVDAASADKITQTSEGMNFMYGGGGTLEPID